MAMQSPVHPGMIVRGALEELEFRLNDISPLAQRHVTIES